MKKNTILIQGYPEDRNIINLERLLFYKQKKRQLKPLFRISSRISENVIDHIKNYLSQEKYRSLIRDSFGNLKKQEQLRETIFSYVSDKDFLDTYSSLITDYSLDEVTDYLVEKIAGLDVLQPLTEIPTVTDIKCTDWNNIWVDDIHLGKYKTDISFESEQAYQELCQRFAFASSKAFTPARPSVNAIFPYMRVNIVGFDLSPRTSLQIRIISKELRYDESYMLKSGFANEAMINLLKHTFATEGHLISGATGTGKTELLRYFTKYTPDNADIIVIEDNPEMYLDEIYPNKAINMWKNRESTDDSKIDFGYSFHVRNAMRQNPDFIYLQESLGKESEDVLKASETGHIINTTLHAQSALNAIHRFISLCQESRFDDTNYYGKRITSNFKIGIHVKRFENIRRINQIVEYTGFENGNPKANILFEYDSIQKRHIQRDKLSLELWERLLDHHKDLSSIITLAPTERNVLYG